MVVMDGMNDAIVRERADRHVLVSPFFIILFVMLQEVFQMVGAKNAGVGVGSPYTFIAGILYHKVKVLEVTTVHYLSIIQKQGIV